MQTRPQKAEQEQRSDRSTVLWSGQILDGDQVIACVIVNISPCGAVVRIHGGEAFRSSVILRNPKLGDLASQVTWRQHSKMGLRFLDDQEKIAALIGGALQ